MNTKKPLIKVLSPVIEKWKRAKPLICHDLGIHDYDGMLPDYSESAVLNRITEIKNNLKQLEKVSSPYKEEKFSKFEYNLVKLALEGELFELRDREEFKDNPLIFIFPLTIIEGSFTKRSFAPVEDRISLIIEFERKIPDFLEQARSILKESLPQAKIFMSLQFLPGIINFYSSELESFIVQTQDRSKLETWQSVNDKAIIAMNQFSKTLQEEYMPRAHSNFALGEEKFSELLKRTEFIDIPVDKLLAIGEQDLEQNYNRLKAVLDNKGGEKYLEEIQHDYPAPEELLNTAQKTLDRTKQFVIDFNIAGVPTDEQCTVIETPEFARKFGFAAMNAPGPFEVPEASEAYYYITPPDASWDEVQIQKFMTFFNKSFLEMVTVHEAWPGHYLQLLYNKQSKSDISKLFARSVSMIEGWAHYCEEMVLEQGYEPFDRIKLEIGQLIGALVRNCRYIAAIKMHCKGMSIDKAKKLFLEKAFMTERNAEIEARRGTINPMYLNYTLGKLLLKKLREDYANQLGDNFSLREFHDKLLSYGSPPITTLREILLEDSKIINEVL
ncbi:MAG: DUF885 domain-containing protein [Candidatus Hodarchaeales archaeon]